MAESARAPLRASAMRRRAAEARTCHGSEGVSCGVGQATIQRLPAQCAHLRGVGCFQNGAAPAHRIPHIAEATPHMSARALFHGPMELLVARRRGRRV
jgi:hypothetical protein